MDLYIIKINETHDDSEDDETKDRLHHDQGTDGTSVDTGYLRTFTPGDTVQNIRCAGYVGAWFDESLCIEPFTLDVFARFCPWVTYLRFSSLLSSESPFM